MVDSDIPRTLVYRDIKKIKDILKSNSPKSLECVFYERLVKQPFVMKSLNPPQLVGIVFNNARYIYYLIDIEEDNPCLYLNKYLAKAAVGLESTEMNWRIAAATMALLCNWFNLLLNENKEYIPELVKNIYCNIEKGKEAEIIELNNNIISHFREDGANVTSEIKNIFLDLLVSETALPTIFESFVSDIRTIEDAASNAPIGDVAQGIDYIIECYDPQNGTNAELFLFLNQILNRLKNERSLANDLKTIEEAEITIKQKMQLLESAPEPSPFGFGLSLDNIEVTPGSSSPNVGWIISERREKDILKTIKQYMEGKKNPKDIIMPIRAAIEAGAIRKPTFDEFKSSFGESRIKSKSSLNDYCNPNKNPYFGEIFENMVKSFRELLAVDASQP